MPFASAFAVSGLPGCRYGVYSRNMICTCSENIEKFEIWIQLGESGNEGRVEEEGRGNAVV